MPWTLSHRFCALCPERRAAWYRGRVRRTAVVCVTSVLCTLLSSSAVLPRVLTAIAAERSITLAWLCRTLCLQLLSSGAAAATVRSVFLAFGRGGQPPYLHSIRVGWFLDPGMVLVTAMNQHLFPHAEATLCTWPAVLRGPLTMLWPNAAEGRSSTVAVRCLAGAIQAFHSIATGKHGRNRVCGTANLHSGAFASAVPGLRDYVLRTGRHARLRPAVCGAVGVGVAPAPQLPAPRRRLIH